MRIFPFKLVCTSKTTRPFHVELHFIAGLNLVGQQDVYLTRPVPRGWTRYVGWSDWAVQTMVINRGYTYQWKEIE